MLLILFRDSLGFYTLLLSLFPSLDRPILGEVCFADVSSPFLIAFPRNSYFFKFNFLSDKSSFLPINLWIKLLKPGIPQDDMILS
jgi:hypothetical protein